MTTKMKALSAQEIPAYGIEEVSDYLRIPSQTIYYWISKGRSPLIVIPQAKPPRLSFSNLLECHILSSMRFRGISVQKVRKALSFVHSNWPSNHPLLTELFQTDGVELFIERLPDKLITVSSGGQYAFKEILQAFLQRIELDSAGLAARFFPFVAEKRPEEPKIIQIDPNIAFGRPVIAGTGITTEIIASRFAARESIAALAREYGRSAEEIEEAIRWESKAA